MSHSRSLTGKVALDLPEFQCPPAEPFQLLRSWLESAYKVGVQEPAVGTLATIGESGPSTRIVLIKEIDEEGLILTSSSLSRKGKELISDPRCSINLYWRETMQQVVINGEARPCGDEKSDSEFKARPETARAIAIASKQSEILQDEVLLRRKVDELVREKALKRPNEWYAWRLIPSEIEFWHGSVDRFHRRLAFSKTSKGSWKSVRLQP